jgi:hypothetical protein
MLFKTLSLRALMTSPNLVWRRKMKKKSKRQIKEEEQGTGHKCGGQRGMEEASGMKENRKLKKKVRKRGRK